MESVQEDINNLTVLIAQESAAAHEALQLELDYYEPSLSAEDTEDDEPKCDSNTRQNSSPLIGIRQTDNSDESVRILRSHLPIEEMKLIMNCPKDEEGGSTLQRCMILNRSKRIELLQSYELYSNLLWKIVSDEKDPSPNFRRRNFNQWMLNKVAAPYFKINKGFSHDRNADILRIRASGELSCHFVVLGRRRWTLENQTNLRGAIRLSHYTNKKSKLERDLQYLNSKVSRCESENEKNDYIDQIKNFEEELLLNQENYENDFPPLDSDEFIDWEDISVKDLQAKFSAGTCKAMWKLYLHPDINNQDWQASEIERLHDIVTRNNYQRWEVIAAELGGNRSPYLVCVHFFNALVDRYDRNPFAPEESARLKSIIDRYQIVMSDRRQTTLPGSSGYNYIPWAKVARDFGNLRSRQQLYMHYMYRIRDRDHRTLGSFTASEDVQILYLVSKYGENFPIIAEQIKRSTIQLRTHYLTYLKPMNTQQTRNWTLEDDEKLMDMVKLFGNRLAMISRELDRTAGSVRGRFKTITRYAEAGIELKDMPRRKRAHKQVVARVQSKLLADTLAENNEPLNMDFLRDTLNEKRIRPSGTTKLGRPPLKYDIVDQQLIGFFKITATAGRTFQLRQITEEHLNRCAASIRNIFSMLKVNDLDIPSKEQLDAYGSTFDEIDCNILTLLRNNLRNNDVQDDIAGIYLPPNISNLCVLKGLVMGSQSVENNIKMTEIRKQFKNDLIDLSDKTREAASRDRSIFVERLNNILMWPSILSLQRIEDTAAANAQSERTTFRDTKPKSIGRPKRDFTRIQMMLEARRKQRLAKKCRPSDDNSDDCTSTNTSGANVCEFDNIPSTSLINYPVNQNLILNENPATSVEEVNQLLKAGQFLNSTKTLVKIDKETMQRMQKAKRKKITPLVNRELNQQTKKKTKLEEPYTQCRITRSTVKSATKSMINDNKDDSDISDIERDISILDSILRSK